MTDYTMPIPPRADTKEIVDEMLLHMVKCGGSDLFIMGGSEAFMQLHSNKVKVTTRRLSDKEVSGMLMRLYNENAPSMLGAGERLDFSHEFAITDETEGRFSRERYRFRVNAVGCLRGGRSSSTITLRTIASEPPRWEVLGVEPELVKLVENLSQGLIMVVGATGQGKSTFMSSLLRSRLELPGSNTNLVTIEKPIEYVYDLIDKKSSFVTQLEVGRHIHSFFGGVENALRMAPDVILVGETRDYETTRATLTAAVTGHLTLSTVHADSVAETVQRLIYNFPESLQFQARMQVLQSLSCVVAQRLVEKVGGGRVAIREFHMFDQQDKNEILASANMVEATKAIVHSRGRPMIIDAQSKLDAGLISPETFSKIKLDYS